MQDDAIDRYSDRTVFDIFVWTQMFFDDGGVTQGKYLSHHIYQDEEAIKKIAKFFLMDCRRTEGVLMIWGNGRIYVKKCELSSSKGSETLRLRRV